MKPLTLAEAAQFLRMSRSSLYQRKDIPRYRRPGSRVMLFDQDEIEMWLRGGRIGVGEASNMETPATIESHQVHETEMSVIDISSGPVYHRNGRYR